MFKKFALCFTLLVFSANGMTGEATSLSTVLSSEDGYVHSVMDDPPPAPEGDDWVLIGSQQNRLKDESACLIVVTNVYVWRRPDGNGGYEHAVTTETHVVPLLGCEADEYPGPQ